ncbi:HK97 family phage prohead protease [Nocardioides sp. NPDC101246]|uniref:HK97 family phage prohead protease n=1 Tax=Nocardioides sp. NPDC101246 TaxID=3364336 RepID=UPI003812232B
MTTAKISRSDLLGTRECRSLTTKLEVRSATTDDELVVEGYASTFSEPYELYGGPPWGWTEEVDPGAFDKTLASNPDVPLLLNHEGMPLARTKSGTLQLSTDKVGLKMRASLDKRDPQVQSVAIKLERGDMDEMSFAFWVVRDEWTYDDDSEHRLLKEVNIHKGDVAIVNYGANPNTSVGIADAVRALADAKDDELLALRSGDLRVEDAQRNLSALLRSARGTQTTSLAAAKAVIEGIADL